MTERTHVDDQPAVDSTVPIIETAAPQPAAWSSRARSLLGVAAAIGVLGMLLGLARAGEPLDLFAGADIFGPPLGVVLMFAGAVIAAQSLRLLRSSGPDRPYAIGNPVQAGTAFVVVWLIGSILGISASAQSINDLQPFLLFLSVASLLMAAFGALWVFRRFGAQVDRRWPPAETSTAIRRRSTAWSVFFAFGWGMVSIALALWFESLVVQLASPLLESRIPALRTAADVQKILNDPAIVLSVIALLVVIAPLIEEASKAAGLWLFRGAIRSHGDGLALGFAAGLGFGLIESAMYIWLIFVLVGQGLGWFVFAFIWLRVIAIWLHSVVTSLTGAACAKARLTGDRRLVWGGLLRATLAHGTWNAVLVIFFRDRRAAGAAVLRRGGRVYRICGDAAGQDIDGLDRWHGARRSRRVGFAAAARVVAA